MTHTDESGADALHVRVRTPDGDQLWELTIARHGRDWSLVLKAPVKDWRATGSHCFEAVRELRRSLDAADVQLGVNGARPNAWSSGMQRDMGEGKGAYLLELGSSTRPPTVRTLDPAPLDEVASVAAQDDFQSQWRASRGL